MFATQATRYVCNTTDCCMWDEMVGNIREECRWCHVIGLNFGFNFAFFACKRATIWLRWRSRPRRAWRCSVVLTTINSYSLQRVAHFFVRLDFIRLNFIKYWPIFELVSLSDYLNQENICNNTVTEDPTTPQVCRYTTLWKVSVFKATTDNKTTL